MQFFFVSTQALKEAQKEETGKANRTGRRERRERRERKMRPIKTEIPSYAKPEHDQIDKEEESSESNTDIPEKITYITSFDNEEPKSEKKNTRTHRPLYSEKLKENLDKFKNLDRRKKYSRRYSSTSSSSSNYSTYRRRRSKKSRSSSYNSRQASSRPESSHQARSPKE